MKFYDLFLDFSRKLDELIPRIRVQGDVAEIDAKDLTHKEINDLIRYAVFEHNCNKIRLLNVVGQRYIGTRIFSRNPR
ncbi:MAG: hypothetical protein QW532_04805, partial [Archaeoglobaceae archaeon]